MWASSPNSFAPHTEPGWEAGLAPSKGHSWWSLTLTPLTSQASLLVTCPVSRCARVLWLWWLSLSHCGLASLEPDSLDTRLQTNLCPLYTALYTCHCVHLIVYTPCTQATRNLCNGFVLINLILWFYSNIRSTRSRLKVNELPQSLINFRVYKARFTGFTTVLVSDSLSVRR